MACILELGVLGHTIPSAEFAGIAGETLDTCLWTFLRTCNRILIATQGSRWVTNCQCSGNLKDLSANILVWENIALAVSNIAFNRHPCTTVRTNKSERDALRMPPIARF